MRARAVLLLRQQRLIFPALRAVRCYSAPTPALDTLPAPLRTLADDIGSTQPCFGARGDEVELLYGPEEFYKRLIQVIQRAKRRIIISTLYIGVEQTELIETLRTALKQNPHLRVTILTDLLRSTREPPPQASTASLLLPLVDEFPDRVEAWFYRSPKLRGILERIVPRRFDEGWGLWHAKWYAADDEVILSGANLSSAYFTNRQDRYIHFTRNASLLSYLSSLLRLFTQYSYYLSPSPPPSASPHHLIPLTEQRPGPSLVWPSPSLHPRQFTSHAQATLTAFQRSWHASNPARARRIDVDTWFYPVIQAGTIGIREEERGLGKVLKFTNCDNIKVDLTSGYFGLYRKYKDAVLESKAPFRVIAASPKANGFFGSKGLSGLIPDAYTLLESRFHQAASARGRAWDEERGEGVLLKEWEREGWTYHAKGIWLSPRNAVAALPPPPVVDPEQPVSADTEVTPTPPANTNPFLTFIGSSNLATRSLNLDVEVSLILMTKSPILRKALAAELKGLDKHAQPVGDRTWKEESRKVGWKTRLLVALGVEGML